VTDFEGLVRQLHGHGVRFVLIGGFAGTVHGSPRITVDLDIVYARDEENLAGLARALSSLSPYLRGAPQGLPFRLDIETLRRGLNFTLTTSLGDLDLLGEVTGGGTYEQLLTHANRIHVFGVEIDVVSLLGLIRLKRAAGRPKDIEAIAELETLLEEQEKTRPER
jgi:predicted nucleotidyltransferase